MELLLIRHALPRRIEAGSAGSETVADPPLAPLGRRQAVALAGWLAAEEPFDACYSSPLRRAVETATPSRSLHPDDVELVDGIVEWDRGAASYIPTEAMRQEGHEEWAALVEGRWDQLGIDPEAFRSRVVDAVESIVAAHPGGRVLVVCHGGVINAYASHVLSLPDVLFFDPTYTGVTRVLASRGGHRMLSSLNETAHLRGVGIYEPESAGSASSGS